MTQSIGIETPALSGAEIINKSYTFNSTTDSTTLTVSDDMFAQIVSINTLIKALDRMSGKL